MSTVLIVAKAPVPGQVKTRLTCAISPHDAAGLAAAALLDTIGTALTVPGARCVVALGGRIDDAVDAAALRAVLAECEVFGQVAGGLATRLVAAHRRAADPGGPVLQIGMDTPQVSVELLTAGLRAARHRAVLGPAVDGGWWALGVPAGAAGGLDCILEVPMSTARTGELTRRALTAAGLAPQPLPGLRDVDRPADIAEVAAACPPGSRFRRAAADLASAAGVSR